MIDRNDNEIVMAGEDKHLKARFSIQQVENIKYKSIYFTTLVHFNNIGGRIYFVPVKPFHVIIIRNMLKRLFKTIENETSMIK